MASCKSAGLAVVATPLEIQGGAMRKAISAKAAAEAIPDGASVMFGGFMGVGTPTRILEALVARGSDGANPRIDHLAAIPQRCELRLDGFVAIAIAAYSE